MIGLEKEKILIADDSDINRDILESILEDEYEIVKVADGREALDFLAAHEDVAILLLDLMMPNVSGLEVLRNLSESGRINSLPVIVITGETSENVESEALELGATDFIHKPFNSRLVCQRIKNSVQLYSYKNLLEQKVQKQTEILTEQNDLLIKQTGELRRMNQKIIDVLGTTVEFRHRESYQHINRVKAFTACLAKQFAKDYPEAGLNQEQIDLIVSASSLHDIGKVAVSDAVLLKPGRLTKEEFEEIKTHTTMGGDILKRLDGVWEADFAKTAYEICMYHHERYDGKGYPQGLKGEEIPLSAQIVSVVDVFDALVAKRVYKEAIPKDEAIDMIMNGQCGIFSPRMLKSFDRCKEELKQLSDMITDEELVAEAM